MRTLTTLLLACSLSLISLFALPNPASAQKPLSAALAVNASLRAGPGRTYKALLALRAGTTVTVDSRSADSGWLVVDHKGWIMARQLTIARSTDLSTLPVSDALFGDSAAAPTPNPPQTAANQPAANVPIPNFDPLLYTARFSPAIRKSMRAIFEKGQKLGNNVHVFAKAGECWSGEPWAYYQFGDGRPNNLGQYGYLQGAIDFFSVSPRPGVANSFVNRSQTARGGLTSFGEFDPIWADPKVCETDEAPILCEFRVNKPSVIIVMFGIGDVDYFTEAEFGTAMRQIVRTSINQGVIPILSTAAISPADWVHAKSIAFNRLVTGIAAENNLPLIRLDAALDHLPDKGIDPDGVHPTPNSHFIRAAFTPEGMRDGITIWNFLALHALYDVWRSVLT